MERKGIEKNFTYGELWSGEIIQPNKAEKRGKVLVNPEKFTTNVMFLTFLQRYGYRLYLDYNATAPAYTNVTAREVVISGNYSDRMIGDMLQHELGHLVLFDVNQFISVRPDTMRSSIAKILYTPEHLKRHGIAVLLKVENIIQDIIIETLAEGECVCHGSYVLHGERIGVKHMERLEEPSIIAKEVCDSLLKNPENIPMDSPYSKELESMIDSMLKGLKEDEEEIERAIERMKKSKMDNHANRTTNKKWRNRGKIDKLERAIAKTNDPARRERLEELQDKLRQENEELSSPEQKKKDAQADKAAKERELKKLEGKLERNRELQEILEQQKKDGQAAMANGGGQGDSGEPAAGEGAKDKDHSITRNLTDHLLGDDYSPPGGGHSYDCGFPHPVTIARDESFRNQQFGYKMLNPELRRKRIKISADDGDNIRSNRIKSSENEFTYMKSSKKEFGMEDMLKGKRRLRLAGVNVLIGLDISGSMSREWTTMFKELSVLVEELQKTLDIENIVYFTYNQRLQQHSTELEKLTLRASGGNAFSYVYPELMEKLPIMQKNEIILVTDCGDNLGFKLSSSCEVERSGALVENHISIIDTEGAAFYNHSDMDKDDWSLYRMGDRDLFEKIQMNIENLIDR